VRRKGFTLVELMGVLVIIGLLSLILIPITSSLLKEQTEKQYEQQIVNIELASKNFGSDNLAILPNKDGEYMYITIGQLKAMGYMDEEIINPISNKVISDCAQIKITKNGLNYTYEYDRSTEEDEDCNTGSPGVIISSPFDQYIKKDALTSYLITINDNASEGVINKYEVQKEKISLTGNTDAIHTVVEGNGIYRVIIKGGLVEGRVGLKLDSGAFLKNEIEDLVGPTGLESSEKVVVDNTIPDITFGTDGDSSWAKTATSTIVVTDNLAGGDTTTYKYIYSNLLTSVPSLTFTNGASYSKSNGTGDYYLIARACDKAGNCATENSSVFKLDNTAPTITFGTDGNPVWSREASSTITVADSHSKGDTTTYKYIYSTSSVNPSNSFISGLSYSHIGGSGDYYLIAQACDNIGNCNTKTSNVFKLDNTKPTISSATANDCSSNKRTITVNGSDANSGISGYLITSSTSTPAASSFSSSTATSWTSSAYSSGTYYAWIKDSADNISSYTTVNVEVCDTTGPIITFGTNGSSSYVAEASTTVTATDDSGISSISYGWSTSNTSTSAGSSTTSGSTLNSKCSRTTDGDCYLYVRACDTNNNCSTERTSAFKLDVTAPTITISNYYSCATGLHADYSLSDSGSGVVQYGKIYCDLNYINIGVDCYDFIKGDRLKTIAATSNKNISTEWTTCNTEGDDQPTGNTGCAFWVKAIDAVGNMSKANTNTNIKAFTSTVPCNTCS